MTAASITENTTVKIGFVLALLSAVGSSGYFVGTAHSRINDVEQRVKEHRLEDRESKALLSEIDRRLSRIEGQLKSLNENIGR